MQRIWGFLSYFIGDEYKPFRFQSVGKAVPDNFDVRRRKDKHPEPFFRLFARDCFYFFRGIRENEFGRAQNVTSAVDNRAAPLSVRRKRYDNADFARRLVLSDVIFDRRRRCVFVLDGVRQVFKVAAELVFRQIDGFYAVDFHAAFGNRARFIKTQHVNPCKRFDAVHILREGMVSRKPYYAQTEHDRRKRDKTARDHADQRADCRQHHTVHIVALNVIFD